MSNIAEVKQNKRVSVVMQETGCSEEMARQELISERWNIHDAVIGVKYLLSQLHTNTDLSTQSI